MQAKIIKQISNQYTVLVNKQEIVCTSRGLFRKENITPLVGDNVLIDEEKKQIIEILPRVNELARPIVANVDAALLIMSIKKPNLSLNLLDKLLVNIIHNKITPVICFTKLDLMQEDYLPKYQELVNYYESIGIKVFNNQELDSIISYLKNKTVVLTGQTGAGKTTLLNKIEPSLNLDTNEISKALGRGKHTTRHTEIHQVKGVYFIDTPGYSYLDLSNLTLEDYKRAFIEFSNYPCPFNSCKHFKEEDCAVKEAVLNNKILKSRYENYLKFGGLQ